MVGMTPVAKNTLLAAAWLGSLALVHWNARRSTPADASARPSGTVATTTRDAAAPRATRLLERKAESAAEAGLASPAPVSAGADAGRNDAGLRGISTRGAFEVLSNNDPIDRTANFIDMLRRIDRSNAFEILDAFEQGEFGFDRSREYSLFLYAWGQVDGAAATKHLQEQDGGGWDKMRDLQSALSGWATQNPDQAVEWAKANWKGEENPYLIGVINGVAKTDLTRATQLAESLPYGRVRGMAADVLVDGHLQKGEQAAMDWAESIQDERLRQGIIQRTAMKVGQKEPAMAADWVLRNTSPERQRETVEMIMDTWARRDPAQAAQWVDGQANAETRAASQAALAGQWARRDAEAAGQWLSTKTPGPELDPAIESYVRSVRRHDPARAMQWAGAIQDTEKRRGTLEKVMNDWMERDAAAAQEFLNRKPPAPAP
jgi:hypothetical protein